MRFNVKKKDRRRLAKEKLINGGLWHKWFAWHPVKIDHIWVWGELVERRKVYWMSWGECGYNRYYRLPQKSKNKS